MFYIHIYAGFAIWIVTCTILPQKKYSYDCFPATVVHQPEKQVFTFQNGIESVNIWTCLWNCHESPDCCFLIDCQRLYQRQENNFIHSASTNINHHPILKKFGCFFVLCVPIHVLQEGPLLVYFFYDTMRELTILS